MTLVLQAAVVLVCLAVWVCGFTGLLVLADNATRKDGD